MAKVAVNADLPSLRRAFDFAWKTVRQQFGLFTALILTFFASWVILEVIVITGQRFGILLWMAAHLLFFFVFTGMEIGFIRMCLATYDGKQIRYSDIFGGLWLGIDFFFVQLVYLVITTAGLLLLIVPGAYLGAKYAFYAFYFAEGDATLKGSFQHSSVLSQGSLWFLIWFCFLSLLLNIFGASILGVGLVITVPLSALMKAALYRELGRQ